MPALLRFLPPRWAAARLGRRLAQVWLRAYSRRHLIEFDQLAVARAQQRILRGLVHRAAGTRFGRAHDFARIHTAADFRRLVPLRTPAELWREYGQPAVPHFGGSTWPGPMPYLALPEQVSVGPFPCIPVSAALWQAHQRAGLTALALVAQVRPAAKLFSGRFVLLGDETAPDPRADAGRAGSLEAIAVCMLPPAVLPYLLTLRSGSAPTGPTPEAPLRELAREAAGQTVTCLAGRADRLLRFFEQLLAVSGQDRISKVWPQLAAVFYRRGPRPGQREQLAQLLGPGPLLLESCLLAEGPVALEDPRYGGLRLLTDHGVYFEFVPLEQLGKPAPDRLGATEVQPGRPYALALTSPAGIWACLVGTVVRFASVTPPLLRIEPLAVPQELPRPVPAPVKPERRAAALSLRLPPTAAAPPLSVIRTWP